MKSLSILLIGLSLIVTGCATSQPAIDLRNQFANELAADQRDRAEEDRNLVERYMTALAEQLYGNLETNTQVAFDEAETEQDRIEVIADYYAGRESIKARLEAEAANYKTYTDGADIIADGIVALNEAANREADLAKGTLNEAITSGFYEGLIEIITVVAAKYEVDFEAPAIPAPAPETET